MRHVSLVHLLGVAKSETGKSTFIERMKERIDSALRRHIYGRRLGIVEPVSGSQRETLGLRHFGLRGK